MSNAFSSKNLVATLRDIVAVDRRVALHEPTFAGREWEYVKDCLDTSWVSYLGRYVGEFEAHVARNAGTEHAVAMVSGTAALHMALMLVGVRPGDEVVVPALTFVATANAVAYCGAVPLLAEVEERSLGLDPAALDQWLQEHAEVTEDGPRNRVTRRPIRAILPMHCFGHPVDMDALAPVAERWRLPVVEDAAESIGSQYKGRLTGGLSRISAFSFNGNKVVTTGGGGALATNDAELAQRARHLTTTAKVPHAWEFVHDAVGYNYRMPNLNAAVGCAQMEQLPGFLADKRRLAQRYIEALAGVAGVRPVVEPDYAHSNYWLNALLLDEDQAHHREELLQATNEAGLMTRPVWRLMHRLPMYADTPRMPLPVAESIERRLINLPSSPFLGQSDAA